MINDMVDTAKAYAGVAVSTLCARSKCQGTPSILTQRQVCYILTKFEDGNSKQSKKTTPKENCQNPVRN